jgi:SAM-dependent methyltransferase
VNDGEKRGDEMTQPIANSEQIEFWSGAAGDLWVRFQTMLDGQLEPFGKAVLRTAAVAEGMHVIDVGCGCGATALAAAQAVGASGSVLGVDISPPMLARARERAAELRLDNLRLAQADAQTHAFPAGAADRVISRFGVMFFDDPSAAFCNVAGAMAAGAKLVFACWQGIDKNPWMMVPIVEALALIDIELPTDPYAPGPFAFADVDRVCGMLESAGLEHVCATAFEPELAVAGGSELDTAVDFLMQLGPMRRALVNATADQVDAVRTAVSGAIGPYERPEGVIMPSAAWIVAATKS